MIHLCTQDSPHPPAGYLHKNAYYSLLSLPLELNRAVKENGRTASAGDSPNVRDAPPRRQWWTSKHLQAQGLNAVGDIYLERRRRRRKGVWGVGELGEVVCIGEFCWGTLKVLQKYVWGVPNLFGEVSLNVFDLFEFVWFFLRNTLSHDIVQIAVLQMLVKLWFLLFIRSPSAYVHTWY